MAKESLFKTIGPLIYILTYLINKFITEVPDVIYISMIIVASGFLLSGMILSRNN